jgi:hypothetical protein
VLINQPKKQLENKHEQRRKQKKHTNRDKRQKQGNLSHSDDNNNNSFKFFYYLCAESKATRPITHTQHSVDTGNYTDKHNVKTTVTYINNNNNNLLH